VLRQIVCAPKKAQFPGATAVLSRLSLHPSSTKNLSRRNPRGIRVYIKMAEPGRFHDATLVRIRQPIVPVVQPSQSYVGKDVT
jgi:hypothetical protein